MDSLNTTIGLYEAQLSVASPDEAYKKMEGLSKQLSVAMDATRNEIEKLVEQKNNNPDSYAWIEPMCVSLDDTEETLRQALVHNVTGQELNIKSFNDPNFCKNRISLTTLPPKPTFIEPQEESYLDEMERVLNDATK